ncbi:uncharacterized protein LOC125178766 [Hyalella azteca]|uniref:Uncharacterized protein LOC125178766 n=1 Tax=Hyalella azteca TaxID=294128 RepID=A0A979FRJ6_HYAAZ|nr:uncharacterized protein LOC125178766 [Hyalella azteca]
MAELVTGEPPQAGHMATGGHYWTAPERSCRQYGHTSRGAWCRAVVFVDVTFDFSGAVVSGIDMSYSNEANIKKNIKWGPNNIRVFLEIFQNYELLWNIRHEHYSNKAKRESCMLKLRDDLLWQGLLVPDIAFLRARIKAIKATYRCEVLKIISSKADGAAPDDVYTPRLPWFKTADQFLNSVVVIPESQPKSESRTDEEKEKEEVVIKQEVNDISNESGEEQDTQYSDDVNIGVFVSTVTATDTSEPEKPIASPIAKKRRISKYSRVESAIEKLQKIVSERPSSSKKVLDEYDLFGQHVAGQLRTLPARSAAVLQETFQSLITTEKLKHLPPDPSVACTSASSDVQRFSSDDQEVKSETRFV